MGEVEISIKEEGGLKVDRRYDIRVLLDRLRLQGSARHRVATWPDCIDPLWTVPDITLNRVLKVLFLCTVLLALVSLIFFEQFLTHGRNPDDPATWDYVFHQTWLFGHFQIERNGIAVLAMFATLLTVGVLAKKVPTRSAATRTEVQTICGLVQQL